MVLYRGSSPLYDYSLGVRVHPPLCIAAIQRGMPCIACDNVVDLVHNGSTCRWNKAIASPALLRVENTTTVRQTIVISAEVTSARFWHGACEYF